MKYTQQQQKYINSITEPPHENAVKIIGLLEKVIEAQSRLLISYRVGTKPPDWVFNTLKKARKNGLKI